MSESDGHEHLSEVLGRQRRGDVSSERAGATTKVHCHIEYLAHDDTNQLRLGVLRLPVQTAKRTLR